MPFYADTSFLVAVYSLESDSTRALACMQRLQQPLPFTPFHHHELRTGIRMRVFRKEITEEQRKAAFREIDSDIEANILARTNVPWTEAFREAEDLASVHAERLGVRSFDLLHVGLAIALRSKEFLTFDVKQSALAKAAGMRVRF